MLRLAATVALSFALLVPGAIVGLIIGASSDLRLVVPSFVLLGAMAIMALYLSTTLPHAWLKAGRALTCNIVFGVLLVAALAGTLAYLQLTPATAVESWFSGLDGTPILNAGALIVGAVGGGIYGAFETSRPNRRRRAGRS